MNPWTLAWIIAALTWAVLFTVRRYLERRGYVSMQRETVKAMIGLGSYIAAFTWVVTFFTDMVR